MGTEKRLLAMVREGKIRKSRPYISICDCMGRKRRAEAMIGVIR
jgi:hypothetical protein